MGFAKEIKRKDNYTDRPRVDRGRGELAHDGKGRKPPRNKANNSVTSRSSAESTRTRNWYNSLGRRKRRGRSKRSISPSDSVRLSNWNENERNINASLLGGNEDCSGSLDKIFSNNAKGKHKGFRGNKHDERNGGVAEECVNAMRFSFMKMLCTADLLACPGARF